jgi:uncharacterized protein
VRVLLDSNVWLAILTTDGQCRRTWRTVRPQAQFHASAGILAEIEEKLLRKFGFSMRHARLLTHFVRRPTVPVEITGLPPRVCRDADDDLILAAAIAGRCEYLVTGDNDLLVLKQFNDVAIVTPAEFARRVA